jgi:hypothetical protein
MGMIEVRERGDGQANIQHRTPNIEHRKGDGRALRCVEDSAPCLENWREAENLRFQLLVYRRRARMMPKSVPNAKAMPTD